MAGTVVRCLLKQEPLSATLWTRHRSRPLEGLGGADISVADFTAVIDILEQIKNSPGLYETFWLMKDEGGQSNGLH